MCHGFRRTPAPPPPVCLPPCLSNHLSVCLSISACLPFFLQHQLNCNSPRDNSIPTGEVSSYLPFPCPQLQLLVSTHLGPQLLPESVTHCISPAGSCLVIKAFMRFLLSAHLFCRWSHFVQWTAWNTVQCALAPVCLYVCLPACLPACLPVVSAFSSYAAAYIPLHYMIFN